MTDANNPQDQEFPEQGIMSSVTMSFNLGVSFNQRGDGTKSVSEVSREIYDHIHEQIMKIYGGNVDESYLSANVEYFTQIALMGYIIPNVCTFDDSFKDHLFRLIEEKVSRRGEQASQKPPSIITS